MKKVWLFLALLPSVALATTMQELLARAVASEETEVRAQLSGSHMQTIQRRLQTSQLVGVVSRQEQLAQPECHRYAVRLEADGVELATVFLDLCPGGLPPVPQLP